MNQPGVSIVTCTNQPGFIRNILNKDSLDLKEWRNKAAAYPNVTVYQVPERALIANKDVHVTSISTDSNIYWKPVEASIGMLATFCK